MDRRDAYRIIALLIGLMLLVLLKEVLLIGFLGMLLGVVLSFPIQFLSRWINRGLAVVLTLLMLGGIAGGIGVLAYQPISEQAVQIKERLPEAVRRAEGWFRRNQPQKQRDQSVGEAVQKNASGLIESVLTRTGRVAISLTTLISALVVVIVLGAFLAHEPMTYHQALKALIPSSHEEQYEELWKRVSLGLRHWMGGILVSMTIMGTLTGVGLALAGIQNWFLLAVLTFLGTFIPYVGAISSSVPGLIIALSQSTEKFSWALLVYLAIHIIEGYIVQPVIMRRAVVIQPALLLIWQLIMGALAGVIGVIVATPLLVCVKIIVGYLYIERGLGKKSAQP